MSEDPRIEAAARAVKGIAHPSGNHRECAAIALAAADAVDPLRQGQDWWDVAEVNDALNERLTQVEAERDRYRAALETIVSRHPTPHPVSIQRLTSPPTPSERRWSSE